MTEYDRLKAQYDAIVKKQKTKEQQEIERLREALEQALSGLEWAWELVQFQEWCIGKGVMEDALRKLQEMEAAGEIGTGKGIRNERR